MDEKSAYEFQTISDTERIDDLPETAMVLLEDGGNIKRVPADKVGGSRGMIVNLTAEESSVEQ